MAPRLLRGRAAHAPPQTTLGLLCALLRIAPSATHFVPNDLSVAGMYYPAAVELSMGPTAVAAGTQYLSAAGDGDGAPDAPDSAIRHDELDDPERLMSGRDLEARDALLHDSITAIGPPGVEGTPLVVDAGCVCRTSPSSTYFFTTLWQVFLVWHVFDINFCRWLRTLVVIHYDLYHRRMRRDPGVAPRRRAVIKFLFGSGSPRAALAWDSEDADAAAPQGAVARSVWRYCTGTASPLGARPSSSASQRLLASALRKAQTEAERMELAYQLAEGGVLELTQVLQTREDTPAVKRAAMHALCGAGPAAVAPLLALLRGLMLLPREQFRHELYSALCAVHALGEAVVVPGVDEVQVTEALLEMAAQVVREGVVASGGWPRGGCGHPESSGFPSASPQPKERQTWLPKLLHATCMQSIGLFCQRAAGAADGETLGRIVKLCAECLAAPEVGGGNPDYAEDSVLGSGQQSRQNAAVALRVLFCCQAETLLQPPQRTAVAEACRAAAREVGSADPFLTEYCAQILAAAGSAMPSKM